jgi:hypothetical protein
MARHRVRDGFSWRLTRLTWLIGCTLKPETIEPAWWACNRVR